MTATEAELLADPPVPTQVIVNVLFCAVSGVLLAVPEVARTPLHAPLALHDVASVADHNKEVVAPLATVDGAAVNAIVGTDVTLTATVTDFAADPPGPSHVNV